MDLGRLVDSDLMLPGRHFAEFDLEQTGAAAPCVTRIATVNN